MPSRVLYHTICNPFVPFHFCLGYSPTVKGQLLHVDATSSMLYRTLLEAEMLAVSAAHDHNKCYAKLCFQNVLACLKDALDN